MMCDFCQLEEEFGFVYDKRGIGYNLYAGWWIQTAADEYNEFETDEILYCPMCGEKLEG